MRGEQLDRLIRLAANNSGHRRILVLGSQAALGHPDHDKLPPEATMSLEADLLAPDDPTGEAAHIIEANLGMGSPFHQANGYYADGIVLDEVYLPEGWVGRITVRSIPDRDEDNPVVALYPDLHDVCISKLAAHRIDAGGRRYDLGFVRALLEAGLVDGDVLRERANALGSDVPRAIRSRTNELVRILTASG